MTKLAVKSTKNQGKRKMGKFLEVEKVRQTEFKYNSPYFSAPARADGIYKKKPRAFCIPREYAKQNLYQEIRRGAIEYFARENIKWHDGQDGQPSNHLCSSQVCCVNFLFPFSDKPEALAELLRPVFPTIQRVLPMEKAGQFVSFEWIGAENYLGEKVGRGGKRSRGANFTSADGAVMFQHQDGVKQIVLIEWKYTESYGGTSLKISKSGTDRTEIYAHLYEKEDCPLDKTKLSDFGDLFYEPFYQLARQQFLAYEMEKARELGAEKVSVLHIAPASNSDFQKVTSPPFRELGATVMEVWNKLVKNEDRFTSVSVEELFGNFPVKQFPALKEWWEYSAQRYSWIV